MFNMLSNANKDYLITINMADLFLSLLWIALLALVVYAIMVVAKVYGIVKDARSIVKENKESVDLIIAELPEITKKVNKLTGDVSHISDSFMPSIDNVADISKGITDTVKENNPINQTLVMIYQILNNLDRVLDKLKRKDEE